MSCPVGQITGIHSPSQDLSPRRNIGRGLFHPDFSNRTAAAGHGVTSRYIAAERRSASPSEPLNWRDLLATETRSTLFKIML